MQDVFYTAVCHVLNLPEKCASFHRTQIIVFQLVVYMRNIFFIHIPNLFCMQLY